MWDSIKNAANNLVIEVGKKLSPPPEKDTFQINGELSPDEFRRAGDHLTEICGGWKWRSSLNPHYSSNYLKQPEKQFLSLEKVICRRRLNVPGKEQKEVEEKIIKEDDD
ncbi:unnamed protein product [Sphagnum balticum]